MEDLHHRYITVEVDDEWVLQPPSPASVIQLAEDAAQIGKRKD